MHLAACLLVLALLAGCASMTCLPKAKIQRADHGFMVGGRCAW